ncbi:hypothetical protein [Nocardiopsis akebiae]|uniref:hypothetical protein n=1 Tax=Nocardiopsis akebiae TaxID=2831968 RepID=UPI0020164374|nr:hypothetical protein [Nocardiopsis akebiae]
MAAVGLYIRLRVEDTPEYRALEDMNNVPSQPVVEVFRSNGGQFLPTVGIETFLTCSPA